MSIQKDVHEKIQEKSPEYANLLLGFLSEIDDNRIPMSRIKSHLLTEITEWVVEEEME